MSEYISSLLFSSAVALVAGIAMNAIGIALAPKIGLFAIPSARRRHAKPVPVSGGLWIYGAMICGLAVFVFAEQAWLHEHMVSLYRTLICISAMMLLGHSDDRKILSVRDKFAAQLVICLAALSIPQIQDFCEAFRPAFGYTIYPLVLIFIAGITNAINFIDGADGLLASTLLIMFTSLVTRANYFGQVTGFIPVMCGLIVPSLFAFSIFNWRPAKIFMGDTGSLPLGLFLVIGCLSLPPQGHWSGSASEVVSGLLQLGYPILDLLWVITKRVRKGFSPFRADQNHLHHCLMRLGFSVPGCVAVLGLLNICFQITSYRVISQPLASVVPELILMSALSLMLVTWIVTVDRWKNRAMANAVTSNATSNSALSLVPSHDFSLLIHAHPLFEGQRLDSSVKAMETVQSLGFLLASNCPKGSQVFWQEKQKILCLVLPTSSVDASDVLGLHARIQKLIDNWIEMFNVSLSGPSLRVSTGAGELSLDDPALRPLKADAAA